MEIAPGTIIRWTNLDDEVHNVSFQPQWDLRTEDFGPGESVELVFPDLAENRFYQCDLHEGEVGSVRVS